MGNDDILANAVLDAAYVHNIKLTKSQIDHIIQYALLLNKWNKKFSLSSAGNASDIIRTHIFDGIGVINSICTCVNELHGIANILDVGSGMGVPGVILAIVLDSLNVQVYAVDSNSKKSAFLTQVKIELKLNNFHIINGRVEDVSNDLRYNIIISRAFGSIRNTMTYIKHIVTKTTTVFFMKSTKINHELKDIGIDNIDNIYYSSLDTWPDLVHQQNSLHDFTVSCNFSDISIKDKTRYIVQLKYR